MTELIEDELESESEPQSKQVNAQPSRVALLDIDFGTEVVKIYVGPKRKQFVVHKKRICESATFFKAAFTSGYEETKSNEMYIPEDHPGAFSLYVNWIYRSTIALGNTESHLHSLFNLYFLGEKLCLVNLKDQVMDSIQDMPFKYDLTDKVFTKPLILGVLKHTTQLRVGSVEGLGDFCIGMMVRTHRKRGESAQSSNIGSLSTISTEDDENLPTTTISNNRMTQTTETIDNENMLSIRPYILTQDLKFVWELSRDNFEVLNAYQQAYAESAQWRADNLSNDQERDETKIGNRCFFHCHDEGWDCRATSKEPELGFVADITETTT